MDQSPIPTAPRSMVMPKPEGAARQKIDDDLVKAGWVVQDADAVNLKAGRGVAVREVTLKKGHGTADYLLYVDEKAAGVVEAKKDGTTLTGVEAQAVRYSEGLPDTLPAHHRPLPFLYQSTGVETRFSNWLDPEPRSRRVAHFHQPRTLAEWISEFPSTLRKRLRDMPPLHEAGLWKPQTEAIRGLEDSFARDRPRALIQMATGSGKTFTAVSAIYRLIKFAEVPRVLFLVDRANLGRQALREFQQYVAPDDGRKFTELYNVQLLASNKLDTTAKVCISTIQRLYSMLKGEADLDPELEEESAFGKDDDARPPVGVEYNPAIPVETFGVIFPDECHRSIYSVWRQVLEYFDAYIVGLTATPGKHTFGFFDQNLVTEYSHEEAVADGVNVGYDVYRIRTQITEHGAKVEAGQYLDKRDRLTRAIRWERLTDDLVYDARALDREIVTRDQIRTVIRTFRDRLFTEIFPGRRYVPKTLIYAKDDSHADDIVQIVREEFGKGNTFCEKITYKTSVARIVEKEVGPDGRDRDKVTYKSTGIKPEDLLSSFRNGHDPRIVVTVDMIATGTDIKPLEIVMFMRPVKSRNFFEQMKGRGVRVISANDLKAVTADAPCKTHFVLVDCVGLCEQQMTDSRPLERKPQVDFKDLLKHVAFGSIDPDELSSLASRLARLERQVGEPDRRSLAEAAGGQTLGMIAAGLLAALDPDNHIRAAFEANGLAPDAQPTPEQVAGASETLRKEATALFVGNAAYRKQLLDVKQRFEQTIDTVSADTVLEARFTEAARERALGMVETFRDFLDAHRDEIRALQILYSRPYAQRLRLADIKALAAALRAPLGLPGDEPDASLAPLWRAYETLEASKVRGASGRRLWTDIVSLVRFALHQADELAPYPELVEARFRDWLARQEVAGRSFTDEQREWLAMIRDHVAGSLEIVMDDLDGTPFHQKGGPFKAYQVFGDALEPLLNELNEVLAA